MPAKRQGAKTPGNKVIFVNQQKTEVMPTVQEINWSRIAEKMAADKQRLEAAIRGDQKARNESTFVHPNSVPAH